MANDAVLSFDEIDQHVENNFKPEIQNHSGDPSAVSLCSIYKVVKPILLGISNFPLLPQKWRDAVKAFVTVLDTMCPGT